MADPCINSSGNRQKDVCKLMETPPKLDRAVLAISSKLVNFIAKLDDIRDLRKTPNAATDDVCHKF